MNVRDTKTDIGQTDRTTHPYDRCDSVLAGRKRAREREGDRIQQGVTTQHDKILLRLREEVWPPLKAINVRSIRAH
jgi:hypothetical protein